MTDPSEVKVRAAEEEGLREAAEEAHAGEEELPGEKLYGLSASSGIASGIALFFSSADLEVAQLQIDKGAVRGEIQRLRMAAAAVRKELAGLSEELEDETLAEAAAFLDVHRSILADPTLISETSEIIRENLVNAEWALSRRLEEIRRDFEQIDDDYLRERIDDIVWVFQRIQRVLAGRRAAKSIAAADAVDDAVVLVADSLDPADMLQLRRRNDLDVVGIVMTEGSATSHAAILAKSLEIPTLVGVQNALEQIRTGDEILIDADSGFLCIRPDTSDKKVAAVKMRGLRAKKRALLKLKTEPAVTLDGEEVSLEANIALPDDLSDVRRSGADGVGLFRTEFLFLNRSDLPSEEEQLAAYRNVVKGMKGAPVTIRLADLGADKSLSRESILCLTSEEILEANPALGLRALRFAFAFPQLYKTQLRAILRACAGESARILLPMISSTEDVRRALEIIDGVRKELEEENVPACGDIQVGGMIEMPAAVAMLGDLIPLLDFFSIGTNDLVQYTLAVDRTNVAVSMHYEELHPAVLRFVAESIRRVIAAGKNIAVCGEMAGRADLAPFFIGLGCRTLSMDPSRIPAVKEKILSISVPEAEEFARSLVRRKTTASVKKAIQEMTPPTKLNLQAEDDAQ